MEFKSWQEQGTSLFSKSSRWAVGPTLPVVQWLPGIFLWGEMLECVVGLSPPPSTKVKNEHSYTFAPPLCLHGIERTAISY